MEIMNWGVYLQNLKYHMKDRYMCEGKNKMDLEGAEREYLNWIDGSENIQK
jgi:hypothetical protein